MERSYSAIPELIINLRVCTSSLFDMIPERSWHSFSCLNSCYLFYLPLLIMGVLRSDAIDLRRTPLRISYRLSVIKYK
jgi:hypothetical protein